MQILESLVQIDGILGRYNEGLKLLHPAFKHYMIPLNNSLTNSFKTCSERLF